MNVQNWLYKLVSGLVSLTLFLQTVVPLAALPPAAHASQPTASSTGLAASTKVAVPAPAAVQTTTDTTPDALTYPLMLSRVQSRYQVGGQVTITYTVSNNQLPTHAPVISETATYTDTVETLAGFTYSDDMNTLHQVAMETTLVNGAAYVSSSFAPTQNGSTYTWALPDVLPGATAVLTLTVQPPVSVTNFTNLDAGAVVTADLWNSSVSDTARPAMLAPSSVSAATLQPTIDADLYDTDMLWETAVFDQDPLAAFAFVRGLAYDPYKGSLRGTRGMLWGEAGNSLDQSSLLIAMLRAASVPARYRHGTLDTTSAQTLLASMFPDTQGVAGNLPDGIETADPLHDATLLALAQDHWWVEAYLPGTGWTDLDPSFATAQPGDIFAVPGSNDRIAEIPDNLRHKLTLELQVEQYNSFPLNGSNLTTFVPLTGTFSTAQVAAKSLILGHVVETDASLGMVFSTVEHTYTPYFGVNGDEFVLLGDSFTDLLTNFPLASTFTSGEWITISTTDADGHTETFTREVKDLIGKGTRLLGGALNLALPDDNAPFITFKDSFVINVLPQHLRNTAFANRQQTRLQYDLFTLAALVDALPRGDITDPALLEQIEDVRVQIEQTRALLFGLTGLEFARRADPMADALQENLGVKLYYDTPRLIIMQGVSQGVDQSQRTVDLRNTTARAIAAPGQAVTAVATAQWVKAIAESRFEGDALRDTLGQQPLTTDRLFTEAQAQGIGFVYVTPDQIDLLDLYLPDPNSYGYAAAALFAGKEVLIPQAPVLIDGESRLGWWEIDPVTGTAVSVLDDGTHGALMEYATLVGKVAKEVINTWNDFGESVRQLWFDCIVDNVVPALNGQPGGSGIACLDGWEPPGRVPMSGVTTTAHVKTASEMIQPPWFYLPDHLCPIDNCGVEQFVLDGYDSAAMPLPETPFQYDLDTLTPAAYAGQVLAVADNGGGGDPAFTLTPSGAGVTVPLDVYSLDISASANFDGQLEVWSYVPPGWSIGFTSASASQVEIVAPEGTPAGDYTILIVSQDTADRSLVATTQHTVTIPAQEAVTLDYAVEPFITVPIGPMADSVSNQTNDSEAEIPDSAFRLDLFNRSHISKSISLTVSGAPDGWVVLDGRFQTAATITLPPFHRTYVGLYVVPPTLPAPGTAFTLVVNASDGGLTDSVSIPWMMPGQPHNFFTVSPPTLYVEANGSTDFDLTMMNVGNMAAAFPITTTTPLTTAVISNLQSPVSLSPGDSQAQTPTLTIGDAVLGRRYPLQFASSAPATNSLWPYTQYAFAEIQIVTPVSGALFDAANACTLDSVPLQSALQTLALDAVELEYWCDVGDCPLPLRDRVVDAAMSTAAYADSATYSNPLTTTDPLRDAAANLALQTEDEDILSALADVSAAVSALSSDLCEVEEHRVDALFNPYVAAILLGETADFNLAITNKGTLTTTYAITITGLPDGDLLFNESIDPGATTNLSITPAPTTLGNFDLQATVAAISPDVQIPVQDTAVARLNVVDQFIQVMQVIADPPFVETGVSSTTLRVEIANPSGVAQTGDVHVVVTAPSGTDAFTAAVPLSVSAGNPRMYDLTAVETSGWAEGVYTVTVDLLDAHNDLIPDGHGYGYFTVGQGLVASQSAYPELVIPGNVTVTTHITTELTQTYVPPDPLAPAVSFGLPAADTAPLPLPTAPISYPLSPIYEIVTETVLLDEMLSLRTMPLAANAVTSLSIGGVFTRTEQDDSAFSYTGTWQNWGTDRASGGSYWRGDALGETAVFTTTAATWINIGFIGSSASGYTEIFIDGVGQGVVDLYRREDTAVHYIYAGLSDAPHVISVNVLNSANSYATNDFVQLDYIDIWDGSALPDGLFEQDDPRVIASTGWSTLSDAAASGGSYMQDNVGTVWFPFSGDSFTFHTIQRSSGGWVKLYVDGHYLTMFSIFDPSVTAATYSYAGFGTGPHILQVSAYRSTIAVDAFTTPGSPPFIDPNPVGTGYTRYEEDHPAWLYNGLPFTQTVPAWSRSNTLVAFEGSGSQIIGSSTAGSTASITVSGEWVQVGFVGSSGSGTAEIFLDGLSQGIIDLYRHDDTAIGRIFSGLSNTNHTISMTVLSGQMWIDYVDVWDGTPLADGSFEAFPSDRFYWSGGWSQINDVNAQNGSYLRSNEGNLWFPFTGDSASYRALAASNMDEARLYLDEQLIDTLDIFNSSAISRTFSFDGLGAGVHIMRVEQHRGNITLDQFLAPAVGAVYNPPAPSGVIRYEEDDPMLRYNGVPYTQTVTTWSRNLNLAYHSSEGYYTASSTTGDTVSLTFTGSWVGVGFLTWRTRGIADVYLDGALLDNIDLYTLSEDTKSVYYTVTPGMHTISVTVSGNKHPHAVGAEIALDYFDVWDGTAVSEGTVQETDTDRLHYSPGWSVLTNAAADGGGYGRGTINNTVWFPFTGDSVTYQALGTAATHEVEIKIDGVSQGIFDIYSELSEPRTYSFDGLGSGAHMLEVRKYRFDITIDAFITPGVPPFYTAPPAPTGIVRYEEDDPALRYNGYPFLQTEYCFLNCWATSYWATASNAYIAESRRAGDWVELDFYGSWAGVGFGSRSDGGVAEVFIDGTSMTTVTLNAGHDVQSVYFSDLITGTHTISVSLVSGRLYFDYFDTWDGTDMGSGWFDADLHNHTSPFHYSGLGSWYTQHPEYLEPRVQFARNDDIIARDRISSNPHLWFTFTGNDLMLLLLQKAGKTVEVFIDGVSQGVLDLTATYSEQPISVYYRDLGSGPHVLHLDATDDPYIDAFYVAPPNFLPYTPVIEWHSDAPTDVYTTTYANSGLLSSAALGDLDGDGLTEIVIPASNGQLYVYRGDGQDSGDGDPILWQSDLVGVAAEPSLADLDGDGKAEIVVMGSAGTAAFHADGSVYWFTDTIKSTIESAGWGGSSIGNLDLEPGPEIVLAARNDAMYVLDHDGSLLFSVPTGDLPAVPILADLTGDGILDIIFAQNKTITVYDAFNNFNVVWSYTHSYPGFYGQAFGSPAVVDVDGKQPGGDDGPEVVINWGAYVDVLDADGSFLWNYYLGSDFYRRPSPITVADVDGDNEIELLTASALQSGFLVDHHKLVVINADGTLLWEQFMGDTSASASGVATQDLDGDGVWEVIWNGLNEGFTILDGPSGEKTFNETFTESGTFVDYPVLGDVDGDGYAEVVTGGYNGLYVIGHDEIWGDSRPIWNEHNYHITNINDDWSVPLYEFNSWDVHNTYRTQTPDRNPSPSYQIAFTYTAGLDNVVVLTHTASISLTAVPPTYTWAYRQEWYQPLLTTTFDSLLTDMQPGEVRQVAAGTEVVYRLPGGINRLTLPPLYVAAPHIVSMEPANTVVWAGETAVFTLTLTNPDLAAATYTLTVRGIPADWVMISDSVMVPGESIITVPLTVTTPAAAAVDTLPVIVDVTTSGQGVDTAMSTLGIGDGLQVDIEPPMQSGRTGQPLTYTLVITNWETVAHTYILTTTGLAVIELPTMITVPATNSMSVVVTAVPPAAGPHPFTVQVFREDNIGVSDNATAVAVGTGQYGVQARLMPETAVGGPGVTTVYTLTLSNLGSLPDTYDLTLAVPPNWTYALLVNGTAVSSIDMRTFPFNRADVRLLLTPETTAAPGDYPVVVTAQSRGDAMVTAVTTATLTVSNRGVQVMLTPTAQSVDLGANAAWELTVRNTGTVVDTYDLLAAGVVAPWVHFATETVTLNPGQAQTVDVTAVGLTLLPQTYTLAVTAVSQTDAGIAAEAQAALTMNPGEGLAVDWQPAAQTVTNTLSAWFTLVLTNTGNLITAYDWSVTVSPSGSAEVIATTAPLLLPPRAVVSLLVRVQVPEPGTYEVVGTAVSSSGVVSDSAAAVLTVVGGNQAPLVTAGEDVETAVLGVVQFHGSATDPDGDAITSIVWDFGDGETAVDTLTPTHAYLLPGVFTVTLTVSDDQGNIGTDTLLVTVDGAVQFLPIVFGTP